MKSGDKNNDYNWLTTCVLVFLEEHIEQNIIPEDLKERLLSNYRDYDKILIENSQEEKVWLYFVDTFLSGVNAKVICTEEKEEE